MNGYIYGHTSMVNMMRRFTDQRNLHRPAVTRFATSFITLGQYYHHKNNLRKFVTSQDWNDARWSKEAGAKRVKQIIMQESFWRNVLYAIRLTEPLVKVLRLVDGERNQLWGIFMKPRRRFLKT